MKNFIKRHRDFCIIMATILIVISALGGLVLASWLSTLKTYPLGDSNKLEYVGEESYGCMLGCDASPDAVYYYATDMSFDQMIAYFKKATLTEEPSIAEGQYFFGIKAPSGSTINTYYYTNKSDVYDGESHLKPTKKAHVLEILKSKYSVALQSL